MERLLLCQSRLGDVDDSACAGNHSVGFASLRLRAGVVDTDMQVAIRASGINRVSQIPRANLAPVEHPAAAILYLCTEDADDLIGKEVALLHPEFRRRFRLSS